MVDAPKQYESEHSSPEASSFVEPPGNNTFILKPNSGCFVATSIQLVPHRSPNFTTFSADFFLGLLMRLRMSHHTSQQSKSAKLIGVHEQQELKQARAQRENQQ
jgi:hypothetical protein